MNDDITLPQLIRHLAEEQGPDLRGYKYTTLERRIRRRMSQLGLATFAEYLEHARKTPTESVDLLNTVLINFTEFFRDPAGWQQLREEALPRMLNTLRNGDLRAWSVGCATGEEPYSLAILLGEFLGTRVAEYDIKIYATDVDEDALNTARQGIYSTERLRRMRPELRAKYFTTTGDQVRINRDVRRMVVFGRSNLVSDAPISHCHLVVCRNLLIFFDNATQRRALVRLHYALEPGGILFLGKAESKLTDSRLFRPINSRWRIFQRIWPADVDSPPEPTGEPSSLTDQGGNRMTDQLQSLRLYQRHILETLKSGVIVLDAAGTIISHNDAALAIWALGPASLNGKHLQNTKLIHRCPELMSRLESTGGNRGIEVTFECRTKNDGSDRLLSLVIRPVLSDGGQREGSVIYTEDVTDREKLRGTVDQLEAASEKLQSANEELETTNEELQSSNEELETTNEELQSTNEELQTTNEELQSLNEELENMNEELEMRSQELNQLNSRYADTLKVMPWPVVLVDGNDRIQVWNAAAQELFGVGETSVVGIDIDRLPLASEARKALLKRYHSVLIKGKPTILGSQALHTDHALGDFDIHFTPVLNAKGKPEGVLIMFGPSTAKPRQPEPDGKLPKSKPGPAPALKSNGGRSSRNPAE